MNGLRPGRPKAYNLYTADEARAFLGRVRGVTNERQARRTFAAEAASLGIPIAMEETTTRFDAEGMEPPSALTLEWREDVRSYAYRAYDPDVDVEDGFFELVRDRLSHGGRGPLHRRIRLPAVPPLSRCQCWDQPRASSTPPAENRAADRPTR